MDEKDCANCGLGMFSMKRNQKTCSKCSKGQYANVLESSSCKLCPRGTYGNLLAGQTESSACLNCKLGRYSDKEGLVIDQRGDTLTCDGCFAGRWSGVSGANKESLCEFCGELYFFWVVLLIVCQFSHTLWHFFSIDCFSFRTGTIFY